MWHTALSQLTGNEICGARSDAVSCINLLWFMASHRQTDDTQLGLNESLAEAKCRNIFQMLSQKWVALIKKFSNYLVCFICYKIHFFFATRTVAIKAALVT